MDDIRVLREALGDLRSREWWDATEWACTTNDDARGGPNVGAKLPAAVRQLEHNQCLPRRVNLSEGFGLWLRSEIVQPY